MIRDDVPYNRWLIFMKRTAKLTILGGVLTISAACSGAYMYADGYYHQPGPLEETTDVIIPKGAGLIRIAYLLEDASVIDQPELFKIMVKYEGKQAELKAGEYRFEPAISPEAVVEKLVTNDAITHQLTVPEGWTTWQVLQLLKNDTKLVGELPENVPEGVLLPESYHYVYGETRAEVVRRMRNQMTALMDELWAQRAPNLPFATRHEALTLASIVERETGVADERGRVAAVFINRLRKGMRLQSDPTAAYGVTGGQGVLGRRVLRKDLQVDSPYNTYKVRGLPPGPIANPGRASIEGVLNPPETDELYFVADGSGGHAFAKTLKEHNRNVAEWRRFRRAQEMSDAAE